MHDGHTFNDNNFGKFFFEQILINQGGNCSEQYNWEKLSLSNEVLIYNISGVSRVGLRGFPKVAN